jgi:hypothetical protein
LTLQTTLNGSPAPANEANGETVTTSLINRAATFDVTVPGGAEADTIVTPQSFDASSYSAQGRHVEARAHPSHRNLTPGRSSIAVTPDRESM